MTEKIQDLALERPPLAEALLGINFALNPGFSGFLLGAFWAEVAQQFSTPVPRIAGDSDSKIRLTNSNGDRSLQILETGIFVSWLHSDAGSSYPGFRTFLAEFQSLYGAFLDFLDRSGLPRPGVSAISMGYTNKIAQPDDFPEGELLLPALFPDFTWRRDSRSISAPLYVDMGMSFEFPARNGLVMTKIQGPFGSASDSTESYLLFLLEAKGAVTPETPDSELWNWFEEAKKNLNATFTDLTSSSFRKSYWKEKGKL